MPGFGHGRTKRPAQALVATLSAAAIVTPTPDPITLLYVWAPLYLLCEVAFAHARRARRERRAAA